VTASRLEDRIGTGWEVHGVTASRLEDRIGTGWEVRAVSRVRVTVKKQF